MKLKAFFETVSSTLCYLVWDEETGDAVIIDPVLDYDSVNHRVSTEFADGLVAAVQERGLTLHWCLETHVHADHLSSARYLAEKLGCKVGISAAVRTVQNTFGQILGLGPEWSRDGSSFEGCFEDHTTIHAGSLLIQTIATPGHTPACMSYLIEDALFVGDALFMPDFGTGRCDFPDGSATDLFQSVTQRIYGLPDETRIFVGHDYQPGGRELAFETSVGASKQSNKQIKADTSREEFVQFRTERDKQLNLPRLLYQSLQVNLRAGRLPTADTEGHRFLKIPIAGPTDWQT